MLTDYTIRVTVRHDEEVAPEELIFSLMVTVLELAPMTIDTEAGEYHATVTTVSVVTD